MTVGRKVASASRELVERYATDGGVQPLDVLFESMRMAWRLRDWETACQLAVQLAPYVHPRQQAVDLTGKVGVEVGIVRLPVPVDDVGDWQRQYAPGGGVVRGDELTATLQPPARRNGH